MNNSEKIRDVALQAGFDLFGITNPSVDKSDSDFFNKWLDDGCGADMSGWLARGASKRTDPSGILDGVKSVICLGVNYYPGNHKEFFSEKQLDLKGLRSQAPSALVARYAWGDDYHEIIGVMCESVCDFLIKNYGDEPKWYTDTGAVFERYFAVKAGLGFIGKNTCLITREFGSWVFLAVIFSRIKFETTKPDTVIGSCGSCERCIKACPTGALSEKRVDSRKCISYLTIEKKGEFSEEEKSLVSRQKFCFGCDACQEVCPHNIRAKKTTKFNPVLESLSVDQLSSLDLSKSPLKRAKIEGLKRNLEACQ